MLPSRDPQGGKIIMNCYQWAPQITQEILSSIHNLQF